MTCDDLVDQLLKLSSEERLQAAEKLWDSVVDEPDGPFALSEKQMKEIERRMKDHERDPSTAIPWEVARARLLSRFG